MKNIFFRTILVSLTIISSWIAFAQRESDFSLPEVLVLRGNDYNELHALFPTSRKFSSLKFIPHPSNADYLSVHHCQISRSDLSTGGRNCEPLDGGNFIHRQSYLGIEESLREIEVAENRIRNGYLFVASSIIAVPVSLGLRAALVSRGVSIPVTEFMGLPALAGMRGTVVEIAAGVMVDKALLDPIFLRDLHQTQSLRCEEDSASCGNLMAIVRVSSREDLRSIFNKLQRYIPQEVNAKVPFFFGRELVKRRSRECERCFYLESLPVSTMPPENIIRSRSRGTVNGANTQSRGQARTTGRKR